MIKLPLGVERVERLDPEPEHLDVGVEQRAAERGERGPQLVHAPRLLLAARALVREEVAPPVDQHAGTTQRSCCAKGLGVMCVGSRFSQGTSWYTFHWATDLRYALQGVKKKHKLLLIF